MSNSPNALFTAYDLEEEPILMRVHINDSDQTLCSTANSAASWQAKN
jgi:hypothetical protein